VPLLNSSIFWKPNKHFFLWKHFYNLEAEPRVSFRVLHTCHIWNSRLIEHYSRPTGQFKETWRLRWWFQFFYWTYSIRHNLHAKVKQRGLVVEPRHTSDKEQHSLHNITHLNSRISTTFYSLNKCGNYVVLHFGDTFLSVADCHFKD